MVGTALGIGFGAGAGFDRVGFGFGRERVTVRRLAVVDFFGVEVFGFDFDLELELEDLFGLGGALTTLAFSFRASASAGFSSHLLLFSLVFLEANQQRRQVRSGRADGF